MLTHTGEERRHPPREILARKDQFALPDNDWAWESVVFQWVFQSRPGVLPTTATASGAVTAEVNDGRWIVKCPDCTGAMAGEPSHPFFMCDACWNIGNSGRWYSVTFPVNRVALETELLKRPLTSNRNWLPGETLADLVAQNLEHGIV
jgi:hypothetical protein